MKKRSVILLIFLLGIGVLGYFGYQWYQKRKQDPYATFVKPRLELANFQIKSLTREGTVMDMNMLIDNPAPVGFEIKNLNYNIYIAGTEVMESSYPKSMRLEGNDSSTITMPVTVHNEKLIERLKELEDKHVDSVIYRIKGNFSTDLPFLKKPIDFEVEKKLPLYRIPKASFEKAKLEKLGLNRTKVIIEAEVENQNAFPLKFKDIFFKMMIDKDKLMEGQIDSAINIPANGKVDLKLPIELSLKETGETVFEMLTNPKEVDYSFYFESKLDSKDNALKNSQIVMQGEGKLKDLLKKD